MAVPTWQSVQTNGAFATTMSITKPTSTAAGDLLLAFVQLADYTKTLVAPAGWTAIRQDVGNVNVAAVNLYSYYRVADGSEGSSFAWTCATNAIIFGAIHRITGAHATSPIGVSGGQVNDNTSAGTAPTITTKVNDSLVVYAAGGQVQSNATPPTGMTEQYDVNGTTFGIFHSIEGATLSFPTAGATGSKANSGWGACDSGAQLVAVNPQNALMGTLTDDFATIDTAKWNNWGTTHETIVSGELTITGTTAANYFGMDTQVFYDLTGSAASIKVTNIGNQALTSWEVYPLHLYLDASNDVKWYISGNTLQAMKTIAGASTNQGASQTYSLVTHKFLRIREASGTVFWDYSADGTSWTNQTSISVSSLFPILSLKAEIICGTWQAEATNTSAKFDNFNLFATIITGAATASGTGALSATGTLVKVGVATASGTGALSATGTVIKLGVATASGTGALSSTAIVITFGASSMSGTGALSATGTLVRIGVATMSGTGALSASGVIVIGGVVVMSGIGTFTVSGDVIVTGIVIMSAVGGMSIEAIRFAIFYPPVKAARRMTYPSDRVGLVLFTRSNKYVGVNVYILSNGVVTEIEPQDVTPPRPTISKTFYGGHDPYVISDEERVLLVAAGYAMGVPQP